MKKFEQLQRPEYPKDLIYRMVVGKSERAWFIPTNIPNPGDQILVTDSKDWNKTGEGFGGRILELQLENDPIPFELKGGWHSNGGGLFSDTGVDLTQCYLTHCSIAKKALKSYPAVELEDILYEDKGWVLGDYDRGDILAKIFANELGEKVYLAKQSLGGGSYGYVQPNIKGE